MQFDGSTEIHAPRDRVWAFLTDPEQVGGCGPGVQSIEKLDDGRFKAHARIGVGFISAKFVVTAEFKEMEAPSRATILARGNAPGSAVDATARMSLRDGDAGVTVVDWTADVNISGTIVSVGARLIEGTAHKMIGQTFDCIRSRLEA